MRLLILGGTGFLGPHIVETAVERGHEMTLFNRGRTNPHLFPDLEKLEGNRDPKIDEGLTPLEGREWDAVIDTSGYVPRLATASAELLADAVKQYLFVSTISVYPNEAFANAGVDEETPVGVLEDETTEAITNESYGPLKALCEQAVERALPGRTTIVRPGLIVGPGDPTDRFTYWPVRISQGGETLAPSPSDLSVQFIDARDLALFIIRLIEDGHHGVYHGTGPAEPLRMDEFLYGCKAATAPDDPADFVWVDEDFLQEQGVGAFFEMPLWIPGEAMRGFGQVSIARGRSVGLSFRPLAETAHDTIEWHRAERPDDYVFGAQPGKGGLNPEKERAVLEAWRKREA
ncbi:MAG: NAD-dependent epimerase/dehydratase family protein [Phycisphaerales bacterium]